MFFILGRYLKKLKINNLTGANNKEFISILLEEVNPELEVEGSNHLSKESLEKYESTFEKNNKSTLK